MERDASLETLGEEADAVALINDRSWRGVEAIPRLESPAPAAAPDPVMDPIVRAVAVAVASDAHHRKLLFLRINVPGRGGVDIRMRRCASGIEVSLHAEDESFRRELYLRRGELAQRGRDAGIGLSRIQIFGLAD